MLDLWQANGRGKVPLTIVAMAKFLAICARNRGGKFVNADRSATHFDLAIRFQVANVSPRFAACVLFAVNVIKVRVPINCCQKPIEARLVGRFDELGRDAADRFVVAQSQQNQGRLLTPQHLDHRTLLAIQHLDLAS